MFVPFFLVFFLDVFDWSFNRIDLMAMLLCAVVAAWYSLKKVSWYYPLMCFFFVKCINTLLVLSVIWSVNWFSWF